MVWKSKGSPFWIILGEWGERSPQECISHFCYSKFVEQFLPGTLDWGQCWFLREEGTAVSQCHSSKSSGQPQGDCRGSGHLGLQVDGLLPPTPHFPFLPQHPLLTIHHQDQFIPAICFSRLLLKAANDAGEIRYLCQLAPGQPQLGPPCYSAVLSSALTTFYLQCLKQLFPTLSFSSYFLELSPLLILSCWPCSYFTEKWESIASAPLVPNIIPQILKGYNKWINSLANGKWYMSVSLLPKLVSGPILASFMPTWEREFSFYLFMASPSTETPSSVCPHLFQDYALLLMSSAFCISFHPLHFSPHTYLGLLISLIWLPCAEHLLHAPDCPQP